MTYFFNLMGSPKPYYMASKTTVGYNMTMSQLITIASFHRLSEVAGYIGLQYQPFLDLFAACYFGKYIYK